MQFRMHGLQCNLNKNMIDIKDKIQVLTASAPGIINGKRASQELSFSAATECVRGKSQYPRLQEKKVMSASLC